MAKFGEECLNNWGIHHILSLTVDNTSSMSVGIQHLKKRLMSWNRLVLNGDYIYMHCCAHILNLIIDKGLEEISTTILRIQSTMKYIRSFPYRLATFKDCVEHMNSKYKRSCLLGY